MQSDGNGAFAFEDVIVPTGSSVKAQLIVEVDGYAPYQKILTLTAGDNVSLLAEAAKIPLFKEVVKLSDLSASARMTSVIQFGIRDGADGLESFSRLMSLSELHAEADLPLENGTEATYTFPTGSFPAGVETVEANMQAFDSSDPEDIQYFPGDFSGTGLGGAASAADDEVGLESAAFDMIALKDQNGNPIQLKGSASKLGALVDLSTCNSIWTRRVNSAQAAIIESWGDYDLNDTGYQVPIWSNDNRQRSWKFVGIANYDSSVKQFKVCIPEDWGAYYLNCDSPIAIGQPETVCVNTSDQNGEPLSGFSINGRKGGQYTYGGTNSEGHAVTDLPDKNITGWSYTYRGSLTGWQNVTATQTPVRVDTDACTYELNITGIQDPLSATIYVFANEKDGTPATQKYVYLRNSSYDHYYNRSGYTNDKGYAVFKVEPSVPYVATYMAGRSNVNVNGAQIAPETEDTGRYAAVDVNDTNMPPYGYLYVYQSQVREGIADRVRFYIRGSDRNRDMLALSSFTVDGATATYTQTRKYSGAGYYYLYGEFNTTTWSVGAHAIEAKISDGIDRVTLNATLTVNANRPPVILSIYARDNSGEISRTYWNLNGVTLKAGAFTFYTSAYDPDGDTVTKSIKLDGVVVSGSVNVPEGDHNITVTASDGAATTTQTVRFTAGNQKPVISRAGASKNIIDLNAGETFKLFAYLSDPDGDYPLKLNIKATMENNTSFGGEDNVTIPRGVTYIESPETTLPFAGVYTFEARAYDSLGAVSDARSVTVEAIASNRKPEFAHGLSDQSVNINTDLTLTCLATDPEGTPISYSWIEDGVTVGTGSNTLTVNYASIGFHTVSCVATDGDGESATSSAQIRAVDPTVTGSLIVHTPMPGLNVTLHDAADKLKMLDSKVTDANGDVTFTGITGGFTSFSIAVLPSTPVSGDLFFTFVHNSILSNAYRNCEYNSSTATECSSADWCTISQQDTIPDWVFDAAKLTDESGTLLQSSTVDTNRDGVISVSELYTSVVLAFGDGVTPLTMQELPDAYGEYNVIVKMFVDIPTGEYTFTVDDLELYVQKQYSPERTYPDTKDFCTESYFTTELNITDAPDGSYTYIYGSTSQQYYYADTRATIDQYMYVYSSDDDGNYDFNIFMKDATGATYSKLLLDQSKAMVESGYTLAFSAFDSPVKNVTVTDDMGWSGNWNLSLNPLYKGIYMGSIQTSYSADSRVYATPDDTRLTYVINGSMYGNVDQVSYEKGHSHYYTTNGLLNAYKTSDYPMLDVSVGMVNGTFTFSGNEKGLVDFSELNYASSYYGEPSGRFILYVTLFVTPTTFNMDDINLTQSFPLSVATAIASVEASASYRNGEMYAYDYKDYDIAGLLHAWQSGTDFWEAGNRYAKVGFYEYANSAAPRGAQKPEQHTNGNPFVIKLSE